MMTKNVIEKLHSKFAEKTREGNLRIREDWHNVLKNVTNNAVDAQREDVVNWVEQVGNEMSVSRLELVQSMFDASMEIVDHHVG